jgi:hypothetical protein
MLRELIETNITRKLIPKGLSWFGCVWGDYHWLHSCSRYSNDNGIIYGHAFLYG